jgi:hypothetical protein
MPRDANGRVGAALESRLLLPLKTLASYGIPPHAFRDYFQMSETLARECCVEFDEAIKQIYYETEYLKDFLMQMISSPLLSFMRLCTVFLECLDLWIACMRSGRIVPHRLAGFIQRQRKKAQLCSRQSVIITFGFGMRYLVMRDH